MVASLVAARLDEECDELEVASGSIGEPSRLHARAQADPANRRAITNRGGGQFRAGVRAFPYRNHDTTKHQITRQDR